MIVVTCSARKGKDQFSLREIVNSTRVVSTLHVRRDNVRDRRMMDIIAKTSIH